MLQSKHPVQMVVIDYSAIRNSNVLPPRNLTPLEPELGMSSFHSPT